MSSILNLGGTSCDCFSINGKTNLLQGDEDPLVNYGQNGDVYFQSNGTIWSKRNGGWQKVESSTAEWVLPTKPNQVVLASPSESGFTISYMDDITAEVIENTARIDLENEFTNKNTFTSDTILDKTTINGETTIKGNTTISGKTYLGNDVHVVHTNSVPVIFNSNNLDTKNLPTQDNRYCEIRFVDKNSVKCGSINVTQTPTETYLGLQTSRQIGDNLVHCSIHPKVDTNGNCYVEIPTPQSINVSNAAVNTTFLNSILGNLSNYMFSEQKNNYVKFKNGLIIQWGETSSTNPVNLPIPFKNTNYIVLASSTSVGNQGNGWTQIESRTTTSFKLRFQNYENSHYSSSYTRPCVWLAVGY